MEILITWFMEKLKGIKHEISILSKLNKNKLIRTHK